MGKLRSNDSWLSRLIPFGLVGQTKPRHYREMLGVVWENKTELPTLGIFSSMASVTVAPRPQWTARQRNGWRPSVHDRLKLLKLTDGTRSICRPLRISTRSADWDRKTKVLGISYPMMRRERDGIFARLVGRCHQHRNPSDPQHAVSPAGILRDITRADQ